MTVARIRSALAPPSRPTHCASTAWLISVIWHRQDEPVGARVGVLPIRKPCYVQMGAIERWRARQDAVVVVGEALRFYQGVLAAGGASGEIGLVWLLTVERVADLRAPHGHQVDRPEAEILEPLRMAEQARRRRPRIAERGCERIGDAVRAAVTGLHPDEPVPRSLLLAAKPCWISLDITGELTIGDHAPEREQRLQLHLR